MKRGRAFLILLGLCAGGCAGPQHHGQNHGHHRGQSHGQHNGQHRGQHHGQTQRLTPSEKMMWSTYAVGTRKGMATCFVVARRAPGTKGGVTPVIVTSVHMLATAAKGPLYFGVRVPDSKGKLQVAVVEYHFDAANKPVYVRHPVYDVAALQLPISAKFDSRLVLPSFLPEDSIGRPGDEPRVGEDISLLGFPEVFPSTGGAFPVLRGGKIASYSSVPGNENRRFMVNASVYPGDSGGPVFAERRGGKPTLVGMIVQRVAPTDRTMVPLAVAVDAGAIRETLQLLDKAPQQTSPAASVPGARNVARLSAH